MAIHKRFDRPILVDKELIYNKTISLECKAFIIWLELMERDFNETKQTGEFSLHFDDFVKLLKISRSKLRKIYYEGIESGYLIVSHDEVSNG